MWTRGLNKLCGVSHELQTIVGYYPELLRTEIVKQLWAYIRKNNLQDPNNKRKIICNEELRLVFETCLQNIFMLLTHEEMLQAEVLRRIWEYIKVNHLEVEN